MANFNLSSAVSRSHVLEEKDVLRTKHALKDIGYYKEPSYGMTRYSDERMFEGIEKFQKDKGLKVDGVMYPERETATEIGNSLSKIKPTPNEAAATPALPEPESPAPASTPEASSNNAASPSGLTPASYSSNRRTAKAVLKSDNLGDLPQFMGEAWNGGEAGKAQAADLITQVAKSDPAKAEKLKSALEEKISPSEKSMLHAAVRDLSNKSDNPNPETDDSSEKGSADCNGKKVALLNAQEAYRAQGEVVDRFSERIKTLSKAGGAIRDRLESLGTKTLAKGVLSVALTGIRGVTAVATNVIRIGGLEIEISHINAKTTEQIKARKREETTRNKLLENIEKAQADFNNSGCNS